MSSFRTLGDLSTSFLLMRQTADLKTQSQDRAQEVTTGLSSDVSRTLRGDFAGLSSIERRLAVAETERLAIAEARTFAGATQTSLETIQTQAESHAASLLAAPHTPSEQQLQRNGHLSMQAFEALVGALNQQVAGRSMFAGNATDGVAVSSAAAMMADIEAAVAGATTAADVIAAVDTWFDGAGGFETTGYLGSDIGLGALTLGGGQFLDLDTKANDPAFRDLMKGYALGALLEGATLSDDQAGRAELSRTAAEKVLGASGQITDLRARVGDTEAAIDAALTQSNAETNALEIVRVEMIGVDQYEAAARLEAAQNQLETLYALTARVSRLSLVDFLR